MASCNLCKSFGSTKIQYNYDLATQHAKLHIMQLKIIDDGIDTNQIFGQCFPDFAPVNAGASAAKSGRWQLMALCKTLFVGQKSRQKTRQKSMTPHVVCEKCDLEMKILQRGERFNSSVLIEHACFHLKLNIYECCHCVREFVYQKTLSLHLVQKHNLRTGKGHFRSKVDDFVAEISAMIKECFGGKKTKAHSKGITTRPVSAPKIRAKTTGSQLANERQVFCYRLIRKVADRNGNVECRVCSKRIGATKQMSIQCERVKHHAYRHLPTPIFRCRLCSEAYFGRTTLENHLRATHALPLLGNYECLADEHHSEVMTMMNKCFGIENDSSTEVAFRNPSDSKVLSSKSTRSKLADRRQLLCHRLIRKCVGVDRCVQCRLCSKRIIAKFGVNASCRSVMEHACLHLGKKLYKCNKCSITFVKYSGIWTHFKKEHTLPMVKTNYQCFADQFHADIESVLRRCYGEEQNEAEEVIPEGPTSVKHEPEDESVSLLPSKMTTERWALCHQLAREHCDRKDKRIQCRLCYKRISVKTAKTAKGIGGDHAMIHALAHLSTPIYRCKICSDTFACRSSITLHVRRNHALPLPNNYDCLADQFHAEIVAMLHKCYNNEAANESAPLKSQSRAEACVRQTKDGSKQAAERQLVCYRLIRKFINSDGKVECRLCKKLVAAMQGTYYKSQAAMEHALIHLKKPVYRCLRCSYRRPDTASVKKHLREVHALLFANNYESSANKYHSEILEMLHACYGEL